VSPFVACSAELICALDHTQAPLIESTARKADCCASLVWTREALAAMKRGQMCYVAAMLPPKKWTLNAQIRSRRLDQRLKSLAAATREIHRQTMENSRKSLEEDIQRAEEHKQLSARLKALNVTAEETLNRAKKPKPSPDVILRTRTLAREGFFNRAETQRIPVSYGTDNVILECRHSITRMASDVEQLAICLPCIEEWMNNQMQHPEERVA
jgi:hypothetical protein